MVNITPRPLHPHQEGTLFHTEQEAVWVLEPVHTIWSTEKSLFAAGIQTPVRAACSSASVPTVLSHPAPTQVQFITPIYATALSHTIADSFYSRS